MKSAPIYLDRLGAALTRAGINLKRSQILEIAASAFGYHNSNEFSAAAKRGDLLPAAAQPIGAVDLPNGKAIVVLTDVQSGRPYAIDQNFIDQIVTNERSEKIGVTPYGTLALLDFASVHPLGCLNTANRSTNAAGIASPKTDVVVIDRDDLATLIDGANSYAEDLSSGLDDGTYDDRANLGDVEEAITTARRLLDAPTQPLNQASNPGKPQKVEVFFAIVDHKHGTNTYCAASEDECLAEIAEYCREYWSEIAERGHSPATTEGMTDSDIVQTYFDDHDSEYLTKGSSFIDLPPLHQTASLGDHQPPMLPENCLRNANLPSPAELSAIASALTDGISHDIWFDAHDYDGEEAAEDTIEETQNAMSAAADILKRLAAAPETVLPAPAAPRDRDPRPDLLSGPIWLTDKNGELIPHPAINAATFASVGIGHGQIEHLDGSTEFTPLKQKETTVVQNRRWYPSSYVEGMDIHLGASVIYAGKKFHAPTLNFPWAETVPGLSRQEAENHLEEIKSSFEGAVRSLGGQLLIRADDNGSCFRVSALLPFTIAEEAPDIEDYFRALDYLLNGCRDLAATTVRAKFRNQATIQDRIIDIDPIGAATYDCTFELLLMGHQAARTIENNHDLRDELRYAHMAPTWIQTWEGPFEIDIDQTAIDALHRIVR